MTLSALLHALGRYRVLGVLILALGLAMVFVPDFLNATNVGIGLHRSSTVGLIALGLTVALIAGQIDLSVGATFALAGIVTMLVQPLYGIVPGALAGILAGALCGAFNGVFVVYFRVNALVATLASMLIFRAACHWITDSIPLKGEVDIFFSIGLAPAPGDLLSPRSGLFLVGIVCLHAWLRLMVGGRNLFAVGSSPAAATARGLRTNTILFGSFVFCGFMAGLAGVFQSLETNTGSAVFGAELLLPALAAVIVGGTRLEGGRGSALGTLGGVLALMCLTLAMEFQSIPSFYQQIVTGLVLILLIILDRLTAATLPTAARGSVGP